MLGGSQAINIKTSTVIEKFETQQAWNRLGSRIKATWAASSQGSGPLGCLGSDFQDQNGFFRIRLRSIALSGSAHTIKHIMMQVFDGDESWSSLLAFEKQIYASPFNADKMLPSLP